MFLLHGVVFHSVIEQTTFNGNSISFVPAWNHVCFHLVRSTMYINFKFFYPEAYWMYALKRNRCLFNFSKIKEYDYFLHAVLWSKQVNFELICFLNITKNF